MDDKFKKLREYLFATPNDFARFREVVVNVVLATVSLILDLDGGAQLKDTVPDKLCSSRRRSRISSIRS